MMKNYKITTTKSGRPRLREVLIIGFSLGKNSVLDRWSLKGGNRLWEKKQSPIFQTNLNQISEILLQLVQLNHLLTGMTVRLGLAGYMH